MTNHTLRRVIALALILALVLTGCSFRIDPPQWSLPTSARHSETAAPDTEPTQSELTLPEDFDPADYPDAVDYSQVEYQRPDVEGLIAQIDAVTELVEGGAGTGEIVDALLALEADYYGFYTMDAVAYIEYCKDLSNSYFKDEYDYLENQSALVQQSTELLYTAAAQSSHKEELEERYFGEDSLDFYLTHNIYGNAEFVALSQHESALQTEYMALQDSQTVEYNGKTYDFDTLYDMYSDDYSTLYTEIFPAYYEQYNEKCGEIFVQLVQTRQKMAKVAGYDSYADFAYEYSYERDYTPKQAREYLADLRQTLALVYDDVYWESDAAYLDYEAMSMDEVVQAVSESLYLMDESGSSRESYYADFQFMQHFNLWDASVSSSKMPGSYQTYLYTYEEPFVYISPEGTEGDYLTLSHEFGHFIDSMVNDGSDNSIDTCEIFSQGLEMLVLCYNNLPQSTVERLTQLKLYDMLQVLVYQAAYADFEDRVYQCDGDTLTLEAVNDLYEQVMEEYILQMDGMDWYNRLAWIDIMHFFIAPYYVISYCTSADAALQIYQMETESAGEGLRAYQQLMEYAVEDEFVELLKNTKMASPFDDGRVDELAELFQKWLLSE